MTGPHTSSVVSMKVFIEKNVIFEVFVILHLGILVKDRAMAVLVVCKNRSQTPTNLIGRLCDRLLLARSGGAFDLEIVPVVCLLYTSPSPRDRG